MSNRILLLLTYAFSLTILLVGCKDDVEPDNNQELEDVSLSFEANQPPVEIPSGLAQSSNQYAQQVYSQLAQVNSMSTYVSMMQPPEGAEVSTTPISTNSNARAASGDVLVYTYSQTGPYGNTITVAYQVSETATHHKFELFWDLDNSGFQRIMIAEESKLNREGYLEYDFESLGDIDYLFRYEWKEYPDGTFDFTMYSYEFQMDITVNADGSGLIDYYLSGDLYYSANWSADGNSGSYNLYDSEGNIIDSFTW